MAIPPEQQNLKQEHPETVEHSQQWDPQRLICGSNPRVHQQESTGHRISRLALPSEEGDSDTHYITDTL